VVSAAAAARLAAALRRAEERRAPVEPLAFVAPFPIEPVVVPLELPIDMSVPLLPVAPLMPLPPAGGLSLAPKPMFMAWSSADALFAELNFFAHVAMALRVCGP
jgi:hypothetical protein